MTRYSHQSVHGVGLRINPSVPAPASARKGRIWLSDNRLTRRDAYKAVLLKLVPRTFHINILLSRNIQTHLEQRRGTSLCVLAECSFINSFEVSTNLKLHSAS